MLEKMETARDNKEFCAAILADLLKAFDCICHSLLSAKLKAFGCDQNSWSYLRFLQWYIKKNKTKVGSPFSAYLDIIYGVPQGSTLGPLFFNTDL